MNISNKLFYFLVIGTGIALFLLSLWSIANSRIFYQMTHRSGIVYINTNQFKEQGGVVANLLGQLIFYQLGHDGKSPDSLKYFLKDELFTHYRDDIYFYSPTDGLEDENGNKWTIVSIYKEQSKFIVGSIKNGHPFVKIYGFEEIRFKDSALNTFRIKQAPQESINKSN